MAEPKNKNFLYRVMAIQKIYREHKIHDGVNDIWIWRSYIYPVYFISYSRFRDLMGLNVKKKIRELKDKTNDE
jgi:hypothetical protein